MNEILDTEFETLPVADPSAAVVFKSDMQVRLEELEAQEKQGLEHFQKLQAEALQLQKTLDAILGAKTVLLEWLQPKAE